MMLVLLFRLWLRTVKKERLLSWLLTTFIPVIINNYIFIFIFIKIKIIHFLIWIFIKPKFIIYNCSKLNLILYYNKQYLIEKNYCFDDDNNELISRKANLCKGRVDCSYYFCKNGICKPSSSTCKYFVFFTHTQIQKIKKLLVLY